MLMKGGGVLHRTLLTGKRLLCLFLIGLTLLFPVDALAEYDSEHPELLTEDDITAEACILIEQSSGNVIFEKNADAIMYPASTTKIMTVMLGIMAGELTDTVTIGYNGSKAAARALDPDASVLGLIEGEEFILEDLLYGTILRSGNDGAIAIAEYISGTESAFVELMNQAAQVYGMTNTHFVNSHGLHDDYHYTTARDLATLAREAMKDETFAKIAGSQTHVMPATNMQQQRTISTGHRIMLEYWNSKTNSYYYEYITGIKSGTTNAAGNCYVGSAEKDGVQLISVVLKSDQYGVWRDTKRLFEYGFSQYTHVTLTELYLRNPLTVYTMGYDASDVGLGELVLSCSPKDPTKTAEITGTYDEIELLASNLRDLMLVQYTRELKAPITAGEVIGTMSYLTDSGELVEYNLLATRSVIARKDAPMTLEEIVAMTEADENPFPPLTVEIVLIVLSPLLIVAAVVLVIRAIVRRHRRHFARLPKNKTRYVK